MPASASSADAPRPTTDRNRSTNAAQTRPETAFPDASAAVAATGAADAALHRLCLFDLDLRCGHLVTVTFDSWYPVAVQCCGRLAGTWFRDAFYPVWANVDHVYCQGDRYGLRQSGPAGMPAVLIGRRPRDTSAPGEDEPVEPSHRSPAAARRSEP